MTATLTISSRNYSSWSLRGWLLCRLAGLDFVEEPVAHDDPHARRELLLMSPSYLVPCLTDGDVKVWAPIAIAEYLHETVPDCAVFPVDPADRALCRSVAAEMSAGFANLRSALPMNLRARHESFPIFTGAHPDIERIKEIWTMCLERSGGPFLFGRPSAADAMYAPVCTRFRTYGVELPPHLEAYCDTIYAWAPMVEWIAAAANEPEEIPELDMEF